ncbi:MAG: 4a-hydroxytetrahydrobiopterin dehydratase [Myxococcales bacterium]|nr:MAG: 4a-hydroxytetrahydrobiopterin dehydratase [Myxococcales bacterium]
MADLAAQTCIPCKGGVPPLASEKAQELLSQVDRHWRVIDNHHLERSFPFDDFKQALAFTNQVGQIAEEQGHHPDIYLAWALVKVQIWTHKIDGLTESDFILAAKIDTI